MSKSKWPMKYRFWRAIHVFFNTLAWKFVPTDNIDDPRKNHLLWRLNNWAANHYTLWWVKNKVLSKEKGSSDGRKG